MSMNPISVSEHRPVEARPGRIQASAAGAKPWYKEPWPWILMAGPAIVVVASFVTLWLAITSFDGLVEDDYYKQGLAINKTLERDRVAARLKLSGEATLAADGSRVRVGVAGDGLGGAGLLRLRLTHFSRPGLDQSITLQRKGDAYEGNLEPLSEGRWNLTLEDEAKSWRLVGEWRLPRQRVSGLGVAGDAQQQK
jgi:uncharacterized protein